MTTTTTDTASATVQSKCALEEALRTPLAEVYTVLKFHNIAEALRRVCNTIDSPLFTSKVLLRHDNDGTVKKMSALLTKYTPIANPSDANYDVDIDANMRLGHPDYARKTLRKFIPDDVKTAKDKFELALLQQEHGEYITNHDHVVGTSRDLNAQIKKLLLANVVLELMSNDRTFDDYTTFEVIQRGYAHAALSTTLRIPFGITFTPLIGPTAAQVSPRH